MTGVRPMPIGNSSGTYCVYPIGTSTSSYTTTSSIMSTSVGADVINSRFVGSISPEEVISHHLETTGFFLKDGGKLRLIAGIPTIEYVHRDARMIAGTHRGIIDFKEGVHDIAKGTVLRTPDGTCYEVGSDGNLSKEVLVNSRAKIIDVASDSRAMYESLAFCSFREIHLPEGANAKTTLTLPNNTVVTIHADDSITIDDSNEKRLYDAHPRYGFNPYLNCSDLLESFVGWCKDQNVSRGDFKNLPISLFILWIITEAAVKDGDPADEVYPLLTSAVKEHKHHTHRCRHCGKFLSKRFVDNGIHFCSTNHMQAHMDSL